MPRLSHHRYSPQEYSKAGVVEPTHEVGCSKHALQAQEQMVPQRCTRCPLRFDEQQAQGLSASLRPTDLLLHA